MAFLRFLLTVALVARLSYAQFLEVDSLSIDSPSDIYDGAIFDVQFDITFTPTYGAAALIEASDNSLRFLPILALSTDGSSLELGSAASVNISDSQQTTNLTDDDSVTWNNLQASLNLTDVECGNGTVYQYLCISLMPYPGKSWGNVDTSNSSLCRSFVCKAVADVSVSALTITNPDNSVINVGGGQAVEFTVTLASGNTNDDIVGTDNWDHKFYLSAAETSGSVVALTSVSLTNAQSANNLAAGGSLTFSTLAVTLTLDSVTCNDFSYACARALPSSSGYWTDPTTSDNTLCITVTCGACAVKTSLFVMLGAVLLSLLFKDH